MSGERRDWKVAGRENVTGGESGGEGTIGKVNRAKESVGNCEKKVGKDTIWSFG